MTEPAWMEVARSYTGTREIPGPNHNRVIQEWLAKLGAWWTDDETPWCGAFVARCMQVVGHPFPKAWYRAREWASYGQQIAPTVGAILVFQRPGGGGHVGFYVAEDAATFHVLGGNQGNSVNVSRISRGRLLAARWPIGAMPRTQRRIVVGDGEISKNER